MKEELILKGYEYAKAQYAAQGVDVDAAIAKADAIPVSMHCWQGDDVIGFDAFKPPATIPAAHAPPTSFARTSRSCAP